MSKNVVPMNTRADIPRPNPNRLSFTLDEMLEEFDNGAVPRSKYWKELITALYDTANHVVTGVTAVADVKPDNVGNIPLLPEDIDAPAMVRMDGGDENTQQTNQDVFGRQLFYGDACKVVHQYGVYYEVLSGNAYVAGIRFFYPGKRDILIEDDDLPTSVWLDVSWPSDPMVERKALIEVIVSSEVKHNYTDYSGANHYCQLIASIKDADEVTDKREVFCSIYNSSVTHLTLEDAINDNNSQLFFIKLAVRGGVEFRRARNKDEYDSFSGEAPYVKFESLFGLLWVVNYKSYLPVRWVSDDDTEAIFHAITSGHPLNFEEKSFHIRNNIDLVISHCINWMSAGAIIYFENNEYAQSVIKLKVNPHKHKISGGLNIEANKKAFIGFWLISEEDTLGDYPDGYPEFNGEDIVVRNIYRANKRFTGGDGIRIEGGWRSINLTRPRVFNCIMAKGAGILGEEGIFGISILRIGSSSAVTPYHIHITDPIIDTVKSEDEEYQSDQDGYRLFTAYGKGGQYGTEFSAEVIGGVTRNCRNRSFKFQSNFGKIIGHKIVRDKDVGGQDNGIVADIDFQIGSGSVTDLEFYYDTKVPRTIIQNRSRVENYIQPGYCFSNIKGLIINNEKLEAVFYFAGEPESETLNRVGISNVDVAGRIKSFLQIQALENTNNTPSVVNMTNCTSSCLDSWISTFAGGAAGGPMFIGLINCYNLSCFDIPVLLDVRRSSNRRVSCLNVYGIEHKTNYNLSEGIVGNITQIDSIVPSNVGISGIFKPLSKTIVNGEILELPSYSVTQQSASNLLFISIGRGTLNAQGIFVCGNEGVEKVIGGFFEVGGNTEPETGQYRIWVDPNDDGGGIRISNRSGNDRIFTMLIMG